MAPSFPPSAAGRRRCSATRHAYGVCVPFHTRGRPVITSRWFDPSHGGINLGFPCVPELTRFQACRPLTRAGGIPTFIETWVSECLEQLAGHRALPLDRGATSQAGHPRDGLDRRPVRRAVRAHTRQVIQAVGSRDRVSADRAAARFGEHRHTGPMRALVSDPAVDVVCVATPHNFHLPHALLAIGAGKHVLIEKPVGLDAGEAASHPRSSHRRRGLLHGGDVDALPAQVQTSCGNCSPTECWVRCGRSSRTWGESRPRPPDFDATLAGGPLPRPRDPSDDLRPLGARDA